MGPGCRRWEFCDIPEIAQLMSVHALWQHYGLDRATAETRLHQLWREDESGFVWEPEPGKILGFVLFNRSSFGGSGYVRWVGVAAGATGLGIGPRLLQCVEHDLRQNSVFRLLLLCTAWNHGARRFYERMGFSEIGRLPDWVLKGTTEVLYAKHLDSP